MGITEDTTIIGVALTNCGGNARGVILNLALVISISMRKLERVIVIGVVLNLTMNWMLEV